MRKNPLAESLPPNQRASLETLKASLPEGPKKPRFERHGPKLRLFSIVVMKETKYSIN
jgi:hypothetical protein